MAFRVFTTTTPGRDWVNCDKVPDYIDQWVAIRSCENLTIEEDKKCELDPNHIRNYYTMFPVPFYEAEFNGAEVAYQLSNEIVVELE